MLPDLAITDIAPMNSDSASPRAGTRKAKWIARGFLAAFVLSVLTVIYTGLSVDGFVGEFDSGFRSVTFAAGESRSIDLRFDSPSGFSEASLEISLPGIVEFASESEFPAGRQAVTIVPGENVFAVTVRGVEPGSGYLIGRIAAREPIDLYRVFLTVTDQ